MPEEKIETKATEAPVEEEYMPEGDAPFTETTDKATAEAEKESAEEGSEEAKEIADAIKPGAVEDAEPAEEVDEVEEILKPKTEEDKSHVQRRIDNLTAELKTAQAELNVLKGEKATRDGKTPEYTDAQLRTAMKKAMDEGDADLAMDIQDYRLKKMEENLIKRYEEDKQAGVKQAQVIQEEWNQVAGAYSKYADTKIQPLYPGSHADLDLKTHTSLLYQVAMALYWSDDPEKAKYYRSGPGGQKLAVADAFTYILSKKAGTKGKDSEKEKLKRQLQKEKRKKSIVSGVPGEETKTPRRPLTDTERLEEVIAERKKFQEERAS